MSEIDEFVAAAAAIAGTPTEEKKPVVGAKEPLFTKVEAPKKVEKVQEEQKVIEEVKEESKEDFKLNFERIARQDKINKEARKTLEEQRKTLDKDKEELAKYRAFDAQLKTDPLGVLEKLGLPLSTIQQLAQQRNQPLDPKALEKKLKDEIKSEFEAREEKLKQERYAIEEIKLQAKISETIKKEAFDVIEVFQAEKSVQDFMEEYYAQTGEIIEIKKACEIVAKEIASKVEKVKSSKWLTPAEKREEIAKIKSKVVEDADDEDDYVKSAKKQGFKTLSNKMTQTSSTKPRAPQTEDERIQAAIAALM